MDAKTDGIPPNANHSSSCADHSKHAEGCPGGIILTWAGLQTLSVLARGYDRGSDPESSQSFFSIIFTSYFRRNVSNERGESKKSTVVQFRLLGNFGLFFSLGTYRAVGANALQ